MYLDPSINRGAPKIEENEGSILGGCSLLSVSILFLNGVVLPLANPFLCVMQSKVKSVSLGDQSCGLFGRHPQGIWTASELVELCGKHGLLAVDLGEGSWN